MVDDMIDGMIGTMKGWMAFTSCVEWQHWTGKLRKAVPVYGLVYWLVYVWRQGASVVHESMTSSAEEIKIRWATGHGACSAAKPLRLPNRTSIVPHDRAQARDCFLDGETESLIFSPVSD